MDGKPQHKRNGLDDLRAYIGLFVCQALAAELGAVALAMLGQQGYIPLTLSLMLLFVYLLASPLVLLALISASAFDLSKPIRIGGAATIYLGFSSILLWGGQLELWRLATAAWLTVVPTLLLWLWGLAPARPVQPILSEPFVPLRERLRRANAPEPRSEP